MFWVLWIISSFQDHFASKLATYAIIIGILIEWIISLFSLILINYCHISFSEFLYDTMIDSRAGRPSRHDSFPTLISQLGADVKFAVIRGTHPGNYLYAKTHSWCMPGRPWHDSKVPKTTTLPLRWRVAKGERNKNERSTERFSETYISGRPHTLRHTRCVLLTHTTAGCHCNSLQSQMFKKNSLNYIRARAAKTFTVEDRPWFLEEIIQYITTLPGGSIWVQAGFRSPTFVTGRLEARGGKSG